MADTNELFASTEKEALRRYEAHKRLDPFPDIPATLLSSAHIQAYIAKTGMVFPYSPADDPEKERITSASLIMTIGPEVLYWEPQKNIFSDKDKQRYYSDLNKNAAITLRPNSITFLRPAERFNIPDYIAARFNLRIRHVHRGLLLGTGPLMDPGYKGFPMIPVHNLTENEYVLRVGDEFINVEFTKISNINLMGKDLDTSHNFKYIKNRGRTLDYSFTEYIDKNVPQRKVKSSLSSVIHAAQKAFERQKTILKWSIVAAFIAIAALIYGGYKLTISATDTINAARNRIGQQQELETKVEDLHESLLKLQEGMTALTSETAKMENSSRIFKQSLTSELDLIKKEIELTKASIEQINAEAEKKDSGVENRKGSK